jgi:protein-disulfide isomerase
VPLPGGASLPVPVLGIVAFGALFAATLQRDPRQRADMSAPLAYTFGVVGLCLFLLQAFLGHFCSLCIVVDSSALVCGLSVFALSRRGGFVESAAEEQDPTRGGAAGNFALKLPAWAALMTLATGAPLLFPHLVRTTEIPEVIRALYEPGKVTVVEFFDYECPHCRELSPRLKEIVKSEGEVALRYGYSPLPGHARALDAARVTICGGEQGKEGEVAELLFLAGDLSLQNITELAAGVVPDKAALAACLASKRPNERIEDDTRRITAAGFEGLPTTYIGGTRIAGALDDPVYIDAIRRAKDGSDTKGLNPWIYWLGIFASFVGIVMAGGVGADRERGKRA